MLGAACVAAVAAAGALGPRTLGGAHLAIVAGAQTDPQLLTGWLWRILIGSRTTNGFPAHVWSALALFGVLLGVAAVLRRRGKGVAAAVCAAVLLTSPLAAGVVLDPLGGEEFVSLGLVLLMALSIVGFWSASTVARAVLVAALALQDPKLVPAALLYVVLLGAQSYRQILAELAAVVAAVALRVFIAPTTLPTFPITIDFTAGPATIIAIGCALFGVTPVVLFAIGARAEPVIALTRSPFVKCTLLGAAVAVAGLFAQTGDPSPYWLGGEACFVVGLVASAFLDKERGRTPLALAVLAMVAAQLSILLTIGGALPALAVARASNAVETAALQDAADSTPLCIVTGRPGEQQVLANGALFQLSAAKASVGILPEAQDCLAGSRAPDLVVVDNMLAIDWRSSGIRLALAARTASRAPYTLSTQEGIVYPSTRAGTPTGFGAYANEVETPVGTVSGFVVLSGFSYRFACVPASGRLAFAVAGIPNTSFSYDVAVDTGGYVKQVLARGVPAPLHGAPEGTPYTAAQNWQFEEVVLPASRACRSIIFSVPARADTPTNWVQFAGVSI